jgi:hypothetical protein
VWAEWVAPRLRAHRPFKLRPGPPEPNHPTLPRLHRAVNQPKCGSALQATSARRRHLAPLEGDAAHPRVRAERELARPYDDEAPTAAPNNLCRAARHTRQPGPPECPPSETPPSHPPAALKPSRPYRPLQVPARNQPQSTPSQPCHAVPARVTLCQTVPRCERTHCTLHCTLARRHAQNRP